MLSPRRSVIPSLVMAFACASVVSTVFADRSPALDPDDRKPFTHALHVPGAWTDLRVAERQRDCRGCHDYGPLETRDPQRVCTQCHFTDETNQYEFFLEVDDESFRTGLESLRSAGSLFQHGNHLALECRECHAVDASSIEAPILMPKTGGLSLCQECHVGTKPRQATLHFMQMRRDGTPITEAYRSAARAKLPLSLVASLNGTAAMGPNRPGERNVGPFRHGDHIQMSATPVPTTLADLKSTAASAEASRAGNCASCHGPMFDAQAGMASMGNQDQHIPFDQAQQNCGTCHISDENRTPLQFALEHTNRPSRTAATFSHALHLNPERPTGGFVKSSESGYDAIESEGCSACHEPDQAGPLDFALKGALANEHSFKGCQTCHETSAWAPAEHGDWWTPEDHGSWQSCAPCHGVKNPSFADNRVFAEVDRTRPTRFRIESQKHPHISVQAGEAIEESCAECHRQPVKELPSRIREARFRHATHLPPNAGPDSCAGCHGAAVSTAETSASLGLPGAAGSPVTYDAAACTTCHLGSPPEALAGPAAETTSRRVPEFSHAGHVDKLLTDGSAVSCTTCHDPGSDAEDTPGVGTRESAFDCSMCHSHAPLSPSGTARAPSTGQGITATEVAACALCHVSGLPAQGVEFHWPSARIVDLAGDAGNAGQFHPSASSGEGECSSCHVNGERLISSTAVTTGSRVFAVRGIYEEQQTRTLKPSIHRDGARKTPDRVNCHVCHWTNTVGGSTGEGTPPPNPETPFNRKKYGDELDNYPGGTSVASKR